MSRVKMLTREPVMDSYSIVVWIGHSFSAAAIFATLAGLLPPVAASAALVWYVVQLYESKTVQRYLARRRTHKIARLNAKLKLLQQLEHEKEHDK